MKKWLVRFGRRLRLPGATKPFFLVLACWVAAYFFLARPEPNKRPALISRADGTWMYLQLRSHLLDGDWDYRNDYVFAGRYKNGRPKWKNWLHVTRQGHPANPWTMGTGVLLAPFFLAGHGLVKVANLFGAGLPTHGVTLLNQRVTYLGTVFWAFFGLVLMVGFAGRRFGWRPAFVGALAVGLCSPLFFYTTHSPSYSHGVAFFCAAALLWCWDRRLWHRSDGPPGLADWALFGALTGLAALVRPQLVLFALPGALWFFHWAFQVRREPRALVRLGLCGLVAAGCAIVVFGPQMLYWRDVYGSLLTVPNGAWFMQWESGLMWETLFSARSGLFVVTPALLLAALGLVLTCRQTPVVSALLLGLVLITALVNGAAWDFWSGWTYGARRFTGAVAALMVGGAGLIAAVSGLARRRPALVGWSAAVLLVAPLLLFAQWSMGQAIKDPNMSHGRPDRDMTFYATRFVAEAHKKAGNPFTWPHSLWLRLSKGLPLDRYSRVLTDYPLDRLPPWVCRHCPRISRITLDLASQRWAKLVHRGARRGHAARHAVWRSTAPCARLFLPLRLKTRYQLSVELLCAEGNPAGCVPSRTLRINGQPATRGTPGNLVSHRRLRGLKGRWVPFRIRRSQVHAGLNVLHLCGPRFTFRYLRVAYAR